MTPTMTPTPAASTIAPYVCPYTLLDESRPSIASLFNGDTPDEEPQPAIPPGPRPLLEERSLSPLLLNPPQLSKTWACVNPLCVADYGACRLPNHSSWHATNGRSGKSHAQPFKRPEWRDKRKCGWVEMPTSLDCMLPCDRMPGACVTDVDLRSGEPGSTTLVWLAHCLGGPGKLSDVSFQYSLCNGGPGFHFELVASLVDDDDSTPRHIFYVSPEHDKHAVDDHSTLRRVEVACNVTFTWGVCFGLLFVNGERPGGALLRNLGLRVRGTRLMTSGIMDSSIMERRCTYLQVVNPLRPLPSTFEYDRCSTCLSKLEVVQTTYGSSLWNPDEAGPACFPFAQLPEGVHVHILSFLPLDARVRCSLVSRAWRSVSLHPLLYAHLAFDGSHCISTTLLRQLVMRAGSALLSLDASGLSMDVDSILHALRAPACASIRQLYLWDSHRVCLEHLRQLAEFPSLRYLRACLTLTMNDIPGALRLLPPDSRVVLETRADDPVGLFTAERALAPEGPIRTMFAAVAQCPLVTELQLSGNAFRRHPCTPEFQQLMSAAACSAGLQEIGMQSDRCQFGLIGMVGNHWLMGCNLRNNAQHQVWVWGRR